MNTNESDLENELRALRPIAPSAALEERIALELRGTSESRDRILEVRDRDESSPLHAVLAAWFQRLGWAAAGAAAAVAVMLAAQRLQDTPPPVTAATTSAASAYLTADAESELIGADESAIFYTAAAEPFRQMRFLSVERYAWTDPDSGAQIEVEVPREDIVTMPVAMQ
jgi:hypothetical protein